MKIILTIFIFLLLSSTLFASDIGEKIAQKNIKIRGGKAKIAAVKQWKFTIISTDIRANKKDNGIMYFDQSNDAFYVEQTLNGELGIFAWDGEKGWFVAPFLDVVEPSPMDDMTRMGASAQFQQVLGLVRGVFYDYKKDSTRVIFVEKVKIDDKFYNKVKLVKDDMQINVEILVSVTSGLVHKISMFDIKQNPNENIVAMAEIKLSGHKNYSGIIFPNFIETSMSAHKVSLLEFTKIELNTKIDDNKFLMPEARPIPKKSMK